MAGREARSETARFSIGGRIFEMLREPTLSAHPEALLSILVEERDQGRSGAQRSGQGAPTGQAKRRRLREEGEPGGEAGDGDAGPSPQRSADPGATTPDSPESGACTGDGPAATSGSGEDPQGAIFVNRNPELFSYILDYYQNGRIIIPYCVAKAAVLREAAFYGLTNVTADTIEREGSPLVTALDSRRELFRQALEENDVGELDALHRYIAHKMFKLFLSQVNYEPCFPITVPVSQLEGALGFNTAASTAHDHLEGVAEHCNSLGASFGISVDFVDNAFATGLSFRKKESTPK